MAIALLAMIHILRIKGLANSKYLDAKCMNLQQNVNSAIVHLCWQMMDYAIM